MTTDSALGIRVRLGLFATGLVALAALVAGMLGHRLAGQLHARAVEQRLTVEVEGRREALAALLGECEQRLAALAGEPRMAELLAAAAPGARGEEEARAELVLRLEDARRQDAPLRSLLLQRPDGTTLAASRGVHAEQDGDIVTADAFHAAFPRVQDGWLRMHVAHPVRDGRGRVLAVLRAEADERRLAEALRPRDRHLPGVATLLATEDGEGLRCVHAGALHEVVLAFDEDESLDAAVAGASGSAWTRDPSHTEVVSAFVPLGLGTGWGLAARVEARAAFDALPSQAGTLLPAILGLLALALSGAALLARPLRRRLAALAAACEALRRGRVVRLEESGDELGRLAAQLNRLTDSLQRQREQFDAEVSERSDELHRRAEELRAARRAAEDELREQSRALAALALELRAPLDAMLASLLALDATSLRPEQRECLLNLKESAGALRHRVIGLTADIERNTLRAPAPLG